MNQIIDLKTGREISYDKAQSRKTLDTTRSIKAVIIDAVKLSNKIQTEIDKTGRDDCAQVLGLYDELNKSLDYIYKQGYINEYLDQQLYKGAIECNT